MIRNQDHLMEYEIYHDLKYIEQMVMKGNICFCFFLPELCGDIVKRIESEIE